MLNVGVVGLGNVAPSRHIPWIQLNSKAELTAVSDLDEDLLDERTAEYGVPGYTDFEAMLDEEPIDAVHVCTPPQTHLDIGEAILSRGVPVLIEKPAAMDSSEVRRLRDVAGETGTTASVVHNRMFEPPIREARRRVAAGEIGDLVSVELVYARDTDLDHSQRGTWELEMVGSGIGEGLPHQIYLPLSFVDRLGEVSCVTHRLRNDYENAEFDGIAIEFVDDTGDVLLTSKRLANTTTDDVLTLRGTEGVLTVDLVKRGVFERVLHGGLSTGAFVDTHRSEFEQLLRNLFDNGLGFAKRTLYRKLGSQRGESATPHFVAIDGFYDAIIEGTEPPVTLTDAYDCMRVMDAVADSVDTANATGSE